MSTSAATCHGSVQDEVSEVLRCLYEALRHAGVATALALVVSRKRQGEKDVVAQRIGSGASAGNGKGPLVLRPLAASYGAILCLQLRSFAQCELQRRRSNGDGAYLGQIAFRV